MSGDQGSSGDNGKTPDQIRKEAEELSAKALEEKKAAFEKDPSMFICLEDLLVATARVGGGIQILMHPDIKRSELIVSKGEIDYKINKRMTQLEMIAFAAKQKSKIIQQPGAFKKGLKRFLGK